MTREEAIKVLNMVEAHGLADEAKKMAVEALTHDKRTETHECVSETHGDLISREDAIEAIASHDTTNGNTVYFKGKTVIGYIKDLPSASPVHGEWIDEDEVTHKYFKCSECGVGQFNWGEDNYCPNCGAKMGGRE